MGNFDGPGVDYDGLHWLLWRDRINDVETEFNFQHLADVWGVSRRAVFRHVDRMVKDGRIGRTETKGLYTIVNPALWPEQKTEGR